MMRPSPFLIPLLLIAATSSPAQSASSHVTLQQDGWRIDFSPVTRSLTVSEATIGLVMRDLHLEIDTGKGLQTITHMTAHLDPAQHDPAQHDQGRRLILETTEPETAWQFEATPNRLTITSTDSRAVLVGSALASIDRPVSRLLDPRGLPVHWQGTTEVVHNFGGARTVRQSYLPRRNSDVLYLGLGHVSAGGLHSLFDRNTDTAIDFGESSTLTDLPGPEDVFSLRMPLADGAILQLTPHYYTATLGLPFYSRYDDTHIHTAPMVWSSWTSYYEAVTEQDIVRNANWLAKNLKPYGFQYVQVDDGYDRRPEGHSWTEPWNPQTFPHGAKWLADYIHSKGLKAGLWLVPTTSALELKDRSRYLYDKQGKLLINYLTPTLDPTRPKHLDFLRNLFTTLDRQGFDYYKLDGEMAAPAYAPSVDKSRLAAPDADFIANYRQRMAAIRETIGPDRFIELCPIGTPLNGIGYTNSYFNGEDIYNNWQGMHALFSAINSDLFLNHMAVFVMPAEGLELGEPMTVAEATTRRPAVVVQTEREREDPATGFGTTLPEARTLVTYVSLTGVAYPLASVMPELPSERVKLLQATMPTMPILPIDLFSRGTESTSDKFRHIQLKNYIHHYPELIDLKVNAVAGRYDVAAATNWRAEKVSRTVDLTTKLGLPPGRQYVVFDFWKQQSLGVVSDTLNLEIDPHDTRVLFIHPLLDRPQLIGNSRHISGTFSILSYKWEQASRQLDGESETIPGQPYTLWFNLPTDYHKVATIVRTKSGKQLKADWVEHNGSASLTFTGQDEPVAWTVSF